MRGPGRAVIMSCLAAPGLALAHGDEGHALGWTADPLVLGMVGLSSAVYARGLVRLRRRAPASGGLRWWEPWAFVLGQLTVLVALVSPLDALSDVLFSAHMGQHEVLMLVSAPLLVLSRPAIPFLFALDERPRAGLAGLLRRPGPRRAWRWLSAPLVVLVLHGVAVWVWHVPVLFEAALASEWVHAVQHACFFGTAALFWWTLVMGRYGGLGYGVGVAWVFVTAMHTGLLGALATIARRPWYSNSATAARYGLTPLEDQQLAGLLMWVPAGALLLVSALALCAAWLGQAERRRGGSAQPGA